MSQSISNQGAESRNEYSAFKRSFFSSIEIVVTNRCNIGCRHCIYDCQPYNNEKLSKSVIKDLVRQAAALNSVKSIVFTGGEAFLEYGSLIENIALCEELGLEAAAVTNGYWAHTAQTALQKLKELKGLKTLNVSTDSFHQEFVPVERIRNIIRACGETGIKCIVRISYLNNPASEIGAIKKQLEGMDGLYSIIAIPVAPFGRAAALVNSCPIYTYDPYGLPCCGADDPVIDANGDVKFCPGGLVRLVRNQAIKDGIPFIPPQAADSKDSCSLCSYIITDPNNAKLLQRAVKSPEVCQEVALARFKEFGEITMYKKELHSGAEITADIMMETV